MFQLSDIIIVVLGALVGLGQPVILTDSGKAELMLEKAHLQSEFDSYRYARTDEGSEAAPDAQLHTSTNG